MVLHCTCVSSCGSVCAAGIPAHILQSALCLSSNSNQLSHLYERSEWYLVKGRYAVFYGTGTCIGFVSLSTVRQVRSLGLRFGCIRFEYRSGYLLSSDLDFR